LQDISDLQTGQKCDVFDNKEELTQTASTLQALSHPMRLKILCLLGDEEMIVNEILDHVGSTQSNVSQHVEVLRKAGIVKSRRVHNKIYCSVKTDEMMPLISQIKKIFCTEEEKSSLIFT